MPPLSLAADQAARPYDRVLHAIPMTHDGGFLYARDTIATAEDAGTMPTAGFRGSSKSVKDCRLSAGSTIRPRVKSRVGITGGDVLGASDTMPGWKAERKAKPSKLGNRTGKNARKRAKRQFSA